MRCLGVVMSKKIIFAYSLLGDQMAQEKFVLTTRAQVIMG